MLAEIAAANAAFNVIKAALANGKELSALEQLRLQEEELRERMVYAGRPGMWNDWVKFQAAAARKRREAQEAAERAAKLRKAKMEQLVEYIAIGIATVILAGLIIYGIVLYMLHLR